MEIFLEEVKEKVPDCFEEYFKLIKKIGNGSFGTVVHAVYLETGKEVAVKIIQKDKHKNLSKLKLEIEILSSMKHPNIVEFYNYIETKTKIYIIMEYIRFGTLKGLIKEKNSKGENFKEEDVALILKSLLSAIEYIHLKDIVHRDIKPDNILLSHPTNFSSIKLIDFGLSAQYFEDNKETDFCGTLIYMAPEQIGNKIYSRAIDLWSCGIIMYILLNGGVHPFYVKGENNKEYRDKLKNLKQSNIQLDNRFSYMARNFYKQLVDVTPNQRYSAGKALQHPWILREKFAEVPVSFLQDWKQREIKKKMLEVIGIVVFLKEFSDKTYSVKNDAEYIDKVKVISEEKNTSIRRFKERCLDSNRELPTSNSIGDNSSSSNKSLSDYKGEYDFKTPIKKDISQYSLITTKFSNGKVVVSGVNNVNGINSNSNGSPMKGSMNFMGGKKLVKNSNIRIYENTKVESPNRHNQFLNVSSQKTQLPLSFSNSPNKIHLSRKSEVCAPHTFSSALHQQPLKETTTNFRFNFDSSPSKPRTLKETNLKISEILEGGDKLLKTGKKSYLYQEKILKEIKDEIINNLKNNQNIRNSHSLSPQVKYVSSKAREKALGDFSLELNPVKGGNDDSKSFSKNVYLSPVKKASEEIATVKLPLLNNINAVTGYGNSFKPSSPNKIQSSPRKTNGFNKAKLFI